MAKAIGCFSAADQSEVDLYTLDFVNDLIPGDAIDTAAWACTVAVGTDPDASSYLLGTPTIFGTKVTQKAGGFLPGIKYVMTATVATRQGLSLVLWAYLLGETIGC